MPNSGDCKGFCSLYKLMEADREPTKQDSFAKAAANLWMNMLSPVPDSIDRQTLDVAARGSNEIGSSQASPHPSTDLVQSGAQDTSLLTLVSHDLDLENVVSNDDDLKEGTLGVLFDAADSS